MRSNQIGEFQSSGDGAIYASAHGASAVFNHRVSAATAIRLCRATDRGGVHWHWITGPDRRRASEAVALRPPQADAGICCPGRRNCLVSLACSDCGWSVDRCSQCCAGAGSAADPIPSCASRQPGQQAHRRNCKPKIRELATPLIDRRRLGFRDFPRAVAAGWPPRYFVLAGSHACANLSPRQ